MINTYKWTNIDTGDIIEITERHFKYCPRCGKSYLHTNRYKDLEVISKNKDVCDISICINMVFCSACYELYIRQDY